MKAIFSFLLMSVLVNFSGQQSGEINSGDGKWVFKKEKNGIKIYTRDIADSNLKELKIEMSFEGIPLSNILSIIRNANTYPEWMFKCDNARIVNEESSNTVVSYYKFDFPWPLSDRDAYMQSTLTANPKEKKTKITTIAIPKHGEEKEGIVRIEDHINTWEFTELSQNKLKLSYYIKSHPSGNIPDWAVNMAIDKGPTQTLTNLRDLAKP